MTTFASYIFRNRRDAHCARLLAFAETDSVLNEALEDAWLTDAERQRLAQEFPEHAEDILNA